MVAVGIAKQSPKPKKDRHRLIVRAIVRRPPLLTTYVLEETPCREESLFVRSPVWSNTSSSSSSLRSKESLAAIGNLEVAILRSDDPSHYRWLGYRRYSIVENSTSTPCAARCPTPHPTKWAFPSVSRPS